MATPVLGLEIPAFGGLAALNAAILGATRIELNAEGSYNEGGLTPSLEDLKQFISTPNSEIPLRIMIRPRGPPKLSSSSKTGGNTARDFIYSDEEFDIMARSIEEFKNSGLLNTNKGDGFVFGILEEDERSDDGNYGGRMRCWVDKKRCTHLVRAAQPFKCVFHRAFDEIVSCDNGAVSNRSAQSSWERDLEYLAACGFDGILTSGGLGRAIDNVNMLEQIIRRAQALHIEIIVGGGVRTANVGEIIHRLGLRERANFVYLHSACLQGDGSEQINPKEVEAIVTQLK
ncbi:hypothetical protein GGR51DRAFT_345746 [Nemania sp. FL0031]|nr:hypothetical protein GGR51DRAFT_345746 [Nemania sp. FL0031]